METWRFEAIGTGWEIETEGPLPATERDRVAAVIDRFDAEWSRFRADSVVSRLAGGGEAPAPADAAAMLDLYRELSDATAGAVNPLAGGSLAALGYDAGCSLVAGAPRQAPADWTDRLHWTDAALSLHAPAVIDVGALGKGRLVDLVLAALSHLEGRVVVDASGDLAVRGGSIRVALEHPYDPSRAVGVVEVQDRALCASATNRRAWGDGLHHVLDARTGIPVRAWAATWALAPDAMLADAATTALFFDGGPEFADAHAVDWVRMSTDGRVQASAGFPGELFTKTGGGDLSP
ncbi:FAD:protein FMN transferase [Microbacterium bovistercoris]|uniref:FAD:protein FMN transferase n=1 Tax=Microbacterium bovistercoris TaxID=2293570 RepID=A0A371NQ47_9MICO|nr:FAD:protein FMN transferase [Microbacterium bovistercoris]REJ04301.1 FAD:protein FMN transferase [Microbacterium bovistercoris]